MSGVVHLDLASHCRDRAQSLSKLISDAALSDRPVLVKLMTLGLELYDSDERSQLENVVNTLPSLRVVQFGHPRARLEA